MQLLCITPNYAWQIFFGPLTKLAARQCRIADNRCPSVEGHHLFVPNVNDFASTDHFNDFH